MSTFGSGYGGAVDDAIEGAAAHVADEFEADIRRMETTIAEIRKEATALRAQNALLLDACRGAYGALGKMQNTIERLGVAPGPEQIAFLRGMIPLLGATSAQVEEAIGSATTEKP